MQSNLQEKYVCMKDVKRVPDTRLCLKVHIKQTLHFYKLLALSISNNITLLKILPFLVFAEGHLANSENKLGLMNKQEGSS